MKKVFTFLLASLCFSSIAAAQTKTITNADLEKYRRERLKNDPDDERERERLGLPSRAAEKQAREQRAAELSEIAARIREQEAEAENYWQSQAFQLRSEIAAAEAEINYVRARIGEIPPPQTYYAVGYNPYFYSPNCCGSFGRAGCRYAGTPRHSLSQHGTIADRGADAGDRSSIGSGLAEARCKSAGASAKAPRRNHEADSSTQKADDSGRPQR